MEFEFWAVVTSVSPLAIRPESQGDELDVSPTNFVDGLAVNDRVLCLIKDHRIRIQGRPNP